MTSVPSAYTEDALAMFMHSTLSHLGVDLGFTAPLSYSEAVIDTLLAYGENDIADATDIGKLRALAKVAAWQLALAAAAARYDLSDGNQSLKRSQLMGHAKIELERAEAEAQAVIAAGASGSSDSGSAVVSRVFYSEDPYRFVPIEELV